MRTALDVLEQMNSKLDECLAPDDRNKLAIYRSVLSNIDFSRGLHFGSGRDKRELADRVESNDGEVIAIDPDADGLRKNRTDVKVLGDGQRLPFEDDSFDLVFSEYVFEHLPRPRSALEEIDRVLRPGGSFVVLVPNPRHYYARIADLTPFWFHKLWFRLQGVESADEDRFPTQYEWGTYSDIRSSRFDWSLEEFYSFPGPTGYTKILPFHFLFALFDRTMKDVPQYHVSYIAHYRKRGRTTDTETVASAGVTSANSQSLSHQP